MRLLVAEDEAAMLDAIVDVLTYHHYEVETAANGLAALNTACRERFDGLLLDIMMPGMDGISVLRALRAKGDPTPVLLLSARGEVDDRVAGLDAGADDYLPKPFAMTELLARIRAMIRRPVLASARLSLGHVQLDEGTGTLICGGRSEPLSRLEMSLMALLMRNSGIYFSAETLLERVWDMDSDVEVGTVWVYISYLRKKLTALDADIAIRSRRGIGYTLERILS